MIDICLTTKYICQDNAPGRSFGDVTTVLERVADLLRLLGGEELVAHAIEVRTGFLKLEVFIDGTRYIYESQCHT